MDVDRRGGHEVRACSGWRRAARVLLALGGALTPVVAAVPAQPPAPIHPDLPGEALADPPWWPDPALLERAVPTSWPTAPRRDDSLEPAMESFLHAPPAFAGADGPAQVVWSHQRHVLQLQLRIDGVDPALASALDALRGRVQAHYRLLLAPTIEDAGPVTEWHWHLANGAEVMLQIPKPHANADPHARPWRLVLYLLPRQAAPAMVQSGGGEAGR